MPYYCTVPRCTSMAGKAKNVSFHQFPRDEELARLWNDILKRGKPYTKYSKVCSLHFKPEDYTITSVGKNKGQWRTLRKDAVPSQNLPSETPAPYSRKQWESWSQNSGPPHVMDPSIQQQVAQAIYMQTMLAMQAAGTEPTLHQNGPPVAPEISLPHTSNHEDILKGKQTNTDCTSYKCTECTKCFKDPDVFILHKRSHTKDIKSNGVEKENFNMNLTLRSNPILANLLKTNNEVNFDPNIVTMENILMTALAANMDYLRNFSAVKDGDTYDGLNHDRADVNHDRSDINQDSSDVNHDLSVLNHSRTDVNNPIGDLNRTNELNHRSVEIHSRSGFDPVRRDREAIDTLNNVRVDVSLDKGDLSLRETLNHTRDENNERGGDINNSRDDQNQPVDDFHLTGDDNHSSHNHNHARDDLNNRSDLNCVKLPLSYAMDFTSKVELSDIVPENSRTYNGRYYRERYFSTEYDNEENNSNDGTVNKFHVRTTCDTELNESMDSNISNSLVIDEGV